MKRTFVWIVLVAAVAASLPATAKGAARNRYPSGTQTVPCTDGEGNAVGSITYSGPAKLWPPNHKYHDALVTARDEDDGDQVVLSTAATHDQYTEDGTELNGSGNTSDDISPAAATTTGTGSAEQPFRIRAERSGRAKDGRTYTITADATFSDSDGDDSSEDMTTCRGVFSVAVPHDMRPSNR